MSVRATHDGLTEVVLDDRVSGDVPVELVWNLGDKAKQGRFGLWVALGLGLGLWLLSYGRPRANPLPRRLCVGLGPVVVGAGFVMLIVSASRRSVDGIAFGLRQGLENTRSADTIYVGEHDDDSQGRQNFLLPETWSEPFLHEGHPARYTHRDGGMALVTLAPHRAAGITVHGGARHGVSQCTPLTLTLGSLEGKVACSLPGELGLRVEVPASCVETLSSSRRAPGVSARLVIQSAEDLVVERIVVDSGITYVEGESFLNDNRDNGGDGHYYIGLYQCPAHHGALMTFGTADREDPIRVHRRIVLPASGRYELWALLYSEHAPSHARAEVRFRSQKQIVGFTRALLDHPASGHCLLPPTWHRIGVVESGPSLDLDVEVVSVQPHISWADLDLVAFVPLARDGLRGGEHR